MKTIVIYFSQSGNTKRAAFLIANNLGIDAVSITALNMSSPSIDLSEYSDFIIGYPIHDGKIPTPMIDFLSTINWTGRRIYHFCTMGGLLGEIDSQLLSLCEGASIRKPLRLKFSEANCEKLDEQTSAWTNYIKRDSHIF